MINLSKPQADIIKELQSSPGASFLFHGEWAMETAARSFVVYKSKPAWGTFKVLMRYGLVKQDVIHENYVRYSLTGEGFRYTI